MSGVTTLVRVLLLLVVVVVVLTPVSVEMTLENVALGKPTRQKDDWRQWYSHWAVDGIQQLEGPSLCTATNSTVNAWWVVDLLHHYRIHAIRVQNRFDLPGRLTDFYIFVSPSNPIPMLSKADSPLKVPGQLCLHYPRQLPHVAPQELLCDSVLQGRYVYVWKPGNDLLTICELGVLVDVVGATRRVSQSEKTYPGTVGSLVPVHSRVMGAESAPQCCVVCMGMEGKGREVTHFQTSKRGAGTGAECRCLRWSDLDDLDLGLTPDVDWDLWDMNVVVD